MSSNTADFHPQGSATHPRICDQKWKANCRDPCIFLCIRKYLRCGTEEFQHRSQKNRRYCKSAIPKIAIRQIPFPAYSADSFSSPAPSFNENWSHCRFQAAVDCRTGSRKRKRNIRCCISQHSHTLTNENLIYNIVKSCYQHGNNAWNRKIRPVVLIPFSYPSGLSCSFHCICLFISHLYSLPPDVHI